MTDTEIERIEAAECGSGERAMIKLSSIEADVMTAWDGLPVDCGFGFKAAAKRCSTPQHQIRRAVRALARKGLLKHCHCLWDEGEGTPKGGGYILTDAGRDYLDGLATPPPKDNRSNYGGSGERAAIVDWLRGHSWECEKNARRVKVDKVFAYVQQFTQLAETYSVLANAIERGDHLKAKDATDEG